MLSISPVEIRHCYLAIFGTHHSAESGITYRGNTVISVSVRGSKLKMYYLKGKHSN
jgi:hypothetical protein